MAIYESTYSTYHQNYGYNQYVVNVTNVSYNGFSSTPYWGVIRPDFSNLRGYLDEYSGGSGSVTVKGWLVDMSNMTKPIEAHIYIGGPAETLGSGGTELFTILANSERTDVGNAFGVGNYHGYEQTLYTSLSGEQKIYIYALNPETGENTFIDSGTVFITQNIVPTSVSLNKINETLSTEGKTLALTATVSPSNATDKSVTWSSSNTSVATVSSSGVVTAIGNGTAIITAKTKSGNKTATCTVTVTIPTASSDGWYYTSVLPSNITSTSYEIQYQNIYCKYR